MIDIFITSIILLHGKIIGIAIGSSLKISKKLKSFRPLNSIFLLLNI